MQNREPYSRHLAEVYHRILSTKLYESNWHRDPPERHEGLSTTEQPNGSSASAQGRIWADAVALAPMMTRDRSER
jgi:hypothetical protein